MIIIEDIGNGRVRRHSDLDVLLHKVGTEEYYSDPIDLADAPWTYEESDRPIAVADDEFDSDSDSDSDTDII